MNQRTERTLATLHSFCENKWILINKYHAISKTLFVLITSSLLILFAFSFFLFSWSPFSFSQCIGNNFSWFTVKLKVFWCTSAKIWPVKASDMAECLTSSKAPTSLTPFSLYWRTLTFALKCSDRTLLSCSPARHSYPCCSVYRHRNLHDTWNIFC